MKRDQTATVVTLRGGGEFQHRVMSMGVSIGGDIRLIQAEDEGGNGQSSMTSTFPPCLAIGTALGVAIWSSRAAKSE